MGGSDTPDGENALCASPCAAVSPFRRHRGPPFDLRTNPQAPPRQAPLAVVPLLPSVERSYPLLVRYHQKISRRSRPLSWRRERSDRSHHKHGAPWRRSFCARLGRFLLRFWTGDRAYASQPEQCFLCLNQVSECYGAKNRHHPADLAAFFLRCGSENGESGFRERRIRVPKTANGGSENGESEAFRSADLSTPRAVPRSANSGDRFLDRRSRRWSRFLDRRSWFPDRRILSDCTEAFVA